MNFSSVAISTDEAVSLSSVDTNDASRLITCVQLIRIEAVLAETRSRATECVKVACVDFFRFYSAHSTLLRETHSSR